MPKTQSFKHVYRLHSLQTLKKNEGHKLLREILVLLGKWIIRMKRDYNRCSWSTYSSPVSRPPNYMRLCQALWLLTIALLHSPYPLMCNVRKHISRWIIQATFNSQWHQITAVQYYIPRPAITSTIPIISRNGHTVASREESEEYHSITWMLPSQNINLKL